MVCFPAAMHFLLKDATDTPIVSPVIAAQTDTKLAVHRQAEWVRVKNPAASSGTVTVEVGSSTTADGGAFVLDPGDYVDLPVKGMNSGGFAAAGTNFHTHVWITTAASTTASFVFAVNTPDGK